jgi:hypothetical protein
MLITVAATRVGEAAWISMLSREDVEIFGRPVTTGLGSHILLLKSPKIDVSGLLTFDRRSVTLYRIGVTDEAVLINGSGDALGTKPRLDLDYNRVFWVTVGSGLQENYALGLRAGVWGVQEPFGNRIKNIERGDLIMFYGKSVGFALCEVRSSPFFSLDRVWPDDLYPHRILISPPIRRTEAAEFSRAWRHLRDAEDRHYRNVQAAGMAIGGANGIFRHLKPEEVADLFNVLGWST